GQPGAGISQILGLPSVTLAKKIDITGDNKARVERVTADGVEVIEVTLPALITVSNEIGTPAHPPHEGIYGRKKEGAFYLKPSRYRRRPGPSSQTHQAGQTLPTC